MVFLGRWEDYGVKISLWVIIWDPNKAIDTGRWSVREVLLYLIVWLLCTYTWAVVVLVCAFLGPCELCSVGYVSFSVITVLSSVSTCAFAPVLALHSHQHR